MLEYLRMYLVRIGLRGGPSLRRFARQTRPWQWSLAATLARMRFWGHLRIVGVRQRAEDSGRTLRIARELTRAVFVPMLRAVLLVVGLAIAERVLVAQTTFARFGLIEWLGTHRPAPEAYASFLGTILQITAVFLGLYYTAVSVVVSNSYKDVPGGVRQRILREQAGTFYQDTVALAGATALVMNAGLVIGWNTGWFNFGALALLSLGSIFSFVVLGIRLFEFFDPSSLARALTHDIVEKARSATPRGYRWNDVSFQDWYRRQAAEDLQVLRHVVNLAAAAELRAAESLKTVADQILRLLAAYSQVTPAIPVESHWFPRVAQHQSWLTARHTSLSMAIHTGTGLSPDLVPDHSWVESELLAGLRNTLHPLLHRQEYQAVVEIGSRARAHVQFLASRFQITEAISLHRTLASLAEEEMRSVTDRASGGDGANRRSGAIELLSMGPVHLVLGLVEAVDKLTPGSIREFAAKTATQRVNAPIGRPVPNIVREEVLKLRRALDFERAAEGRQVTPTWFLAHHIGRAYTAFLVEVLPTLLDEAESTCLEPVRSIWKEVPPIMVVLNVQRGLEVCHKLQVHLERIAMRHRSLLVLQRPVDTNDAWPVLDLGTVQARVTSLREQLLALLARVAVRLPDDVPTGKSPDDLGFAYTALTEASVQALVDGDWSLFNQIFPTTIHVAFRAHDRVMSEVSNFGRERRITAPASILADVIELSGYALLLSEIQGGSAWRTAKEVWDDTLDSRDDPASLIKYILVRWQVADSSFLWSPDARGMERRAWDQRVRSRLRNLGVDDEHGPGYRREIEQDARVNPLVRLFLHALGSRGTAGDLFLAHYLLERSEARGLEAPDSVREVVKELRRTRSSGNVDQEPGGGNQ